jgi:hypothetical protein
MTFNFQKATKKQARLRMALIGISGSGKTYSALNVAKHLGGRVAVIDTERGSASKYADLFEFDVLEPDTFSPMTYVEAIKAAEAAGYDILIIDSLSHAWSGKDGALEQVDRAAKRSNSGNSFAAWRDITPQHNALVDAMIGSRCHVIATMRAKTEYVQERNEKTGRSEIRKVGLAPVQRDGLEYEFDVVGDMTIDNDLVITKSRCPKLTGMVVNKPGQETADVLKAWLTDGAPAPEPAPKSNGNGSAPTMAQAAQELGGKPKSVMTLKEAEDVKNSEGLRYGDLKDDQLGGMATSIKKAMKKTGVTPEQMEQYKTKLQAIDIILDWRNPAVQGPDETPWEEH